MEVVWWQPEFDAFISGCREMQMHNRYTFADGATRQLHSPDILPATHWLCTVPRLPVWERVGDRAGDTAVAA